MQAVYADQGSINLHTRSLKYGKVRLASDTHKTDDAFVCSYAWLEAHIVPADVLNCIGVAQLQVKVKLTDIHVAKKHDWCDNLCSAAALDCTKCVCMAQGIGQITVPLQHLAARIPVSQDGAISCTELTGHSKSAHLAHTQIPMLYKSESTELSMLITERTAVPSCTCIKAITAAASKWAGGGGASRLDQEAEEPFHTPGEYRCARCLL